MPIRDDNFSGSDDIRVSRTSSSGTSRPDFNPQDVQPARVARVSDEDVQSSSGGTVYDKNGSDAQTANVSHHDASSDGARSLPSQGGSRGSGGSAPVGGASSGSRPGIGGAGGAAEESSPGGDATSGSSHGRSNGGGNAPSAASMQSIDGYDDGRAQSTNDVNSYRGAGVSAVHEDDVTKPRAAYSAKPLVGSGGQMPQGFDDYDTENTQGGSGGSGSSVATEARREDQEEQAQRQNNNAADKAAKKAAKQAPSVVAKHMASKALNGMNHAFQSIGHMASNFLPNLIHGITALPGAVMGAIGGAVSAVGSGILSFLGMTGSGIAAGITAISGATLGTFAATMAITTTLLGATNAAAWDAPLDCVTEVAAAAAPATGSDNQQSTAQELEVAKHIYAFMKSVYNLDDVQIAGLIGNFCQECGLDPSCIEGVEGEEAFSCGPKKQKILADPDSYVRDLCYNRMNPALLDLDTYFSATGGTGFPGIGFAQWTGDQGERFYKLSQQVGADWWTVEYNLAFMLAMGADADGRTEDWDVWVARPVTTPSESAKDFLETYEGVSASAVYAHVENRESFAEQWYSTMQNEHWSSTVKDDGIVATVKEFASKLGYAATEKKTADTVAATNCNDANCKSLKIDASLAAAMVEFSYATQEEATGNDGTSLYKQVVTATHGGNNIGASARDCGVAVCAAVHWSGIDPDFPDSGTALINDYFTNSPTGKERWQCVGTNVTSTDGLMPGDILLTQPQETGHVLVYTGTELIQKKFSGRTKSADVDFCHASLQSTPAESRSCSCGNWSLNTYLSNDGRKYNAYRCVNPAHDTTYSSAGSIPSSTTMCADGAGLEEISEVAAKIIAACQTTPSPGGGLCAKWVTNVYQSALGIELGGNACDQYAAYCHTADRSQLQPGMIVAVPSHPHTAAGRIYGHVGIYIGNNQLMDNIGYIRTMDVDEWINFYGSQGGGTDEARWGFPPQVMNQSK